MSFFRGLKSVVQDQQQKHTHTQTNNLVVISPAFSEEYNKSIFPRSIRDIRTTPADGFLLFYIREGGYYMHDFAGA